MPKVVDEKTGKVTHFPYDKKGKQAAKKAKAKAKPSMKPPFMK